MPILESTSTHLNAPTPQQFLSQFILPALDHLFAAQSSPAAAQLLLATALHESGGLHYRRQVGGGPARSYYQIELATHDDIWQNYLRYRPSLAKSVRSLLSGSNADLAHELEFNDKYSTAIARLKYQRVPEPLPSFGDLSAMASYWKRYYNSIYGKGTPGKFLDDWHHYTKGAALNYQA